ncbi:MAG: hypothetical protein K0Q73_1282 [Paenibacillus sp.]|jgi:hypothetical protein|nr:hypothetical protein [Paenibacillus sp.]
MRLKKFTYRVQRDLDYYLKEHQNKTNRILHYFAFMSAFFAWLFLFYDLKATLILGLLHYLLSWIGHFYFEGNRPASFRYPLIGFYSGFTWFFIKTIEIVTGKDILNTWLNEKRED